MARKPLLSRRAQWADYGIVFGASKTVLRGRVSHFRRPSDVAGVYGAAGAGLTLGTGARASVLPHLNGAYWSYVASRSG